MSEQKMTPERLRDVADVLERVGKISDRPAAAYNMAALVRSWAEQEDDREVFQAEVVKILDRLEPKIERTANGGHELIAALERADARTAGLKEEAQQHWDSLVEEKRARVKAQFQIRDLTRERDMMRPVVEAVAEVVRTDEARRATAPAHLDPGMPRPMNYQERCAAHAEAVTRLKTRAEEYRAVGIAQPYEATTEKETPGVDMVIEVDTTDPDVCLFCDYEQGLCFASPTAPDLESCTDLRAAKQCGARNGRIIVQAKRPALKHPDLVAIGREALSSLVSEPDDGNVAIRDAAPDDETAKAACVELMAVIAEDKAKEEDGGQS